MNEHSILRRPVSCGRGTTPQHFAPNSRSPGDLCTGLAASGDPGYATQGRKKGAYLAWNTWGDSSNLTATSRMPSSPWTLSEEGGVVA